MAATYFILKKGIAPPGLAQQPPSVRLLFWRIVVDLGLKRKDYELARGLNAQGDPLGAIKPETRKHRRSEMTPSGKGDPSAPYLMPGRGLSRTRSLLAGKAHPDYAEFFWRFDPYTGDQWGRVLAWHAARGKAYDVVGLSPAGIASVAREAQRRWRQLLLSATPYPDGALQDTRRRPAATQVHAAPAARTNLTYATFGIGGTKEEAQRAIDEGRSSGFMTGPELRRYLRQSAPVPYLANPGTVSASVRSGHSNVILQQIFGSTPPGAGGTMAKAAMGPKSPPRPRPIPKPKPGPRGRPVAAGLAVDAEMDRETRDIFNHVVEAIGRVHGDGDLPLIPVREYARRGESDDFTGAYYKARVNPLNHAEGMRPLKIEMRPDGSVRHMISAHEIGHFIEDAAIPKSTGPEGESEPTRLKQSDVRRWRDDPLLRPWLSAVEESETHRRNAANAGLERVAVEKAGTTYTYKVDKDYAKYLNSPDELWARSYAQYIATRSKDAALKTDLAEMQEVGPVFTLQWTDEEFEPIARAIDALFRLLGWLT